MAQKEYYEIPGFKLFGRKLAVEADPAAEGCIDSFVEHHNREMARIASKTLLQMFKALTEYSPKEWLRSAVNRAES